MEDLINYERTWKTVRCSDPECGASFQTNDVGDIICPVCGELMYAELHKTPMKIVESPHAHKFSK